MNKKQIRLTESDLHRIVNESVNKILKESDGMGSEFQDGRRTDIYGDGNISDRYPFNEKEIRNQVCKFRDCIDKINGAMAELRNTDFSAMQRGLKTDKNLEEVFNLVRPCLFGEIPSKLNEASRLINQLVWKFTPNRRNGFKTYSEQF